MSLLTRDQIFERLKWMQDAKSGDPWPEWVNGGGILPLGEDWGRPVSELAGEALRHIRVLEEAMKIFAHGLPDEEARQHARNILHILGVKW